MGNIIIKLVKTADDNCNDEINKILLSVLQYYYYHCLLFSFSGGIQGQNNLQLKISAIPNCDDSAGGCGMSLQHQNQGIIE